VIHPVGDVGRGPVYGLLKTLHRLGWQLNLTMSRLAVFQFFDVLFFKSETLKVRELWRITEALNCQITRELAQRVDIRGKFKVLLWPCLYVYGAEDDDFVRSARVNHLGNWLP
jgi:hypothetical protein